MRGLRGAIRLGNANNGDNAGSVYLNGNNAPTNANANYGVVLNRSKTKRVSLPYRENIDEMTERLVGSCRVPYPPGRSTDVPPDPTFDNHSRPRLCDA